MVFIITLFTECYHNNRYDPSLLGTLELLFLKVILIIVPTIKLNFKAKHNMTCMEAC